MHQYTGLKISDIPNIFIAFTKNIIIIVENKIFDIKIIIFLLL